MDSPIRGVSGSRDGTECMKGARAHPDDRPGRGRGAIGQSDLNSLEPPRYLANRHMANRPRRVLGTCRCDLASGDMVSCIVDSDASERTPLIATPVLGAARSPQPRRRMVAPPHRLRTRRQTDATLRRAGACRLKTERKSGLIGIHNGPPLR